MMKRTMIWTFGFAVLQTVWFACTAATVAEDTTATADASAQAVTEPIELLGGDGLNGWTWFTKTKGVSKEDVWSYQDGILRCKGKPGGYLQTNRAYKEYVLDLEWRWSGKKGGNNGVLVHASTPMVLGVWPKSLEVQLHAGDAGDFWVIGQGVDVNVANKGARRKGRRTLNLTDDSEKRVGEWNHMRILCQGDKITVFVNGDQVNQGTELTITKGGICLQSEGTPAEFRNIRLSPIKE